MPDLVKAAMAKNDGVIIHPETCADAVYYDEENGITVKQKIDEILEEMDGMTYTPITINEFKATPSYIERGQVITSITFNFKFNKVPKSIVIKIDGNDYNVEPISEGSHTISNISIKDKQFTCTITIEDIKSGNATKSITINKRNKYFYGVASTFTKLTDLTYKLDISKSMELSVNANEGKYIYFCYPITDINDLASFNVGGFDGGFTPIGITTLDTSCSMNGGNVEVSNNGIINDVKSSSIVNTNNTSVSHYTTNISYIIYKSDNPNLGNTKFKVM